MGSARTKLLLPLAAALFLVAPAQAREEKEPALPEGFVTLPPLLVPVLDDYRVRGHLKARLAVKADEADVREKIEASMPRLTDRYLLALNEFARLWVEPTQRMDAARLMKSLQGVTEQLFPKGAAQVLLLEATVRHD